MNISDAISFLAEKNSTTPEELRNAIQEAIEAAKGNPRFEEIFDGKMPSVDEFIETIVLMLQFSEGPIQ